MSPQEDILSTLNQHASELRESFSVTKIGLFGSFASGTANEKSDVDILVNDQAVTPVTISMNMRMFFNRLAQAANDECCER